MRACSIRYILHQPFRHLTHLLSLLLQMVQGTTDSVRRAAWLVESAEAAFCAVSKHNNCISQGIQSLLSEALPETRHDRSEVSTTETSNSTLQVAEAQLAVLRHCQLLAVGPEGWRTWISVDPTSQLAGSAKVAAAMAAIAAEMDGAADSDDRPEPAGSLVQSAQEAAAAAAAELLAVSDGVLCLKQITQHGSAL